VCEKQAHIALRILFFFKERRISLGLSDGEYALLYEARATTEHPKLGSRFAS
jgi:hypothetical protein